MPLDKVLQKIQSEIKEMTPTLELFFEDTIQPSVNDCENLQKHLIVLQENLAIYKYQKQNKEISPSFNLHAKLSEVGVSEQKQTPPPPPESKTTQEHIEEVTVPDPPKTAEPQEKPAGNKAPSKISVSLNDKFRFINELFAQNSSEYNIAMEQFNNLRSWNDTEIYLNSLKSLYSWEEDKDIVKYFHALIKKRFD
jgi:hypothetical protein